MKNIYYYMNKDTDFYLGNFGIIINKKNIIPEKINEMKKKLTIFPKENKYVKDYEPIICFKETNNHFLVPKFFDSFHEKIINEKIFSKQKIFNFIGTLRKEQEENLKLIFDKLNKDSRCLFSSLTGSGKTVITLKLLSLINKKTLIIVHKHFLLEQWKERIETFLKDVKIGYFYGNVNDTIDKDIIISTIQSISMKEYDKNIFNDINFVIFDECHHVPSMIFSKSLFKIGKKLMLGLSATPERKDGLTEILRLHFGDFLITNNVSFNNKDIFVKVLKYNIEIREKRLYNGLLNVGNLITQISENKERTMLLMKIVKKLNDKQRNILILSDRVNHCHLMKKILEQNNIECSVFIGGLTKRERELAVNQNIIIGTYSMISEGFDLPKLNTLIMMTPKTDIIQIVGRILRQKHDKPPLIIDINDSHYQTEIWQKIRFKQYKELGFKIKT